MRLSDADVKMVAKEITELFIDAGIHLDAVNCDGLKASQVCSYNTVESFIKNYEVQAVCLKCIAARSIAQHRINYRENIPKQLELFVQLHCAAEKS